MSAESSPTDSAQTEPLPVGTLLSVNVGMPKDVPWRGKTVFTGVFKDPVSGPCRVRKLNVDGDGQGDLGGHGGEQRAVFVYQIDSYRYWERVLDRSDLVHGQFGENLHRRRSRIDDDGLHHRRPLSHRNRGFLRGDTAARHLLPRRHPHERPADSGPACLPSPPRVLPARCSKRARCRRPMRSSSSRVSAPNGCRPWSRSMRCSTFPGIHASNSCARCESPP